MESIGVEHEGVTLVKELDFGGFHFNAFQVHYFWLAFQECVFGIANTGVAACVHLLGRKRNHGWLVAIGSHAQQHFGHVAGLGGDPVNCHQVVA